MAKKAIPLAAVGAVAPQVAVAGAAAEQLADVGQAVVKAATTPIYARKRREVWDPENEEWVPVDRERELQVTPAAIAVGGLLALGAAAVGQRAIRTGTAGLKTQWEFEVTHEGERAKKVWVDREDYLSPRVGDTVRATGRTRRRPIVRVRDGIADYQPVVRGL